MKNLAEFARPGVYLLVGESDAGPHLPRIYIGEADDLRERMEKHYRERDWWTRLIAFSSSDDFFNKAHVQFVESRLLELARAVRRAQIDNQNLSRRPRISEADIADAERFLDYMLLLLPILGVSAFDLPNPEEKASPRPIVTFILDQRGAKAEGYPTPDGFLVRAGARGRAATLPGANSWIKPMREELTKSGILAADAETLVLTQDYVFTSSSTAAAVFIGGHASGPKEWHTIAGKSLRDHEAESVSG